MTDNKQKSIILDENGICINGNYKILLASSLFYFRIPRERWEDRMLLLKAAGYNAIDTYFPWNYHETAPGQWSFSHQRDVSHFLELAAKHELFVIARPGPYICSEWDGGAIPAWLSANGVPVRQDDPVFLDCIGKWYEHILPLIAPWQITKGGTVICMQIENELDFFDCKSPVTYMEKLMKKVKKAGIEIPLFYCCGQNDLLRGGGLTPGLYTAFNVYADADNPGLEGRSLHLYQAVRDRKMPFLVTETNREHAFLKRLLSCGAKLLSPYNQTAGSTLEWYNGITNWGTEDSPLSFLCSDYDFHSMIGSAGEVNEQIYESRLLSSLILSLGDSLAKATPVPIREIPSTITEILPSEILCSIKKRINDTTILLHTNRGDFFCYAPSSLQTRLLPLHLILDTDGNTVLETSNYEIAYISENQGFLTVGMYGEGTFFAKGTNNKEAFLLEKEPACTSASASFPTSLQEYKVGSLTFVVGSPKAMALSHIPGLPDLIRKPEEQENVFYVDKADTSICTMPLQPISSREILPMEKNGQYRGIGRYAFTLKQDSTVLIQNIADIFTLKKEGILLETSCARGNCLKRTLSAGDYELYTEIWGHSNFNDIRCRSLQMGSLKGISGLFTITGEQNLNENWLLDLDDQPLENWYFFRHSNYNTVSSIDSYNRAVMPLRTVYNKWVYLPQNADSLFLHFSKADCIISVYVNGHFEGNILPDDPYMDLSAYAGNNRIELCLRILRRFYADKAGDVTLLYGNKITECSYASVPVESLQFPDTYSTETLPLQISSGEHTLLRLKLPNISKKDLKLYVRAKDIKLTFLLGNRIVGRLLLTDSSCPAMAGGNKHIVHLLKEWLEQNELLVWCQPIGSTPVLSEIEVREYDTVIAT